jgi:hypothetical protein
LAAGRADSWRQRSEQYFTCSQSRAHFLRQVNGRAQCAQGLAGRSAFERIFAMLPMLLRIQDKQECSFLKKRTKKLL